MSVLAADATGCHVACARISNGSTCGFTAALPKLRMGLDASAMLKRADELWQREGLHDTDKQPRLHYTILYCIDI